MGQTTKVRQGEAKAKAMGSAREGMENKERKEERRGTYRPFLLAISTLDANPCLIADCKRIETFAFACVE